MQVLFKQQQSKNRVRAGDLSDDRVSHLKKRNTRPEPRALATTSSAASSSFGEKIFMSSEAAIVPCLASLCSYDDDSDPTEFSAAHQVPRTAVGAPDNTVQSKPATTSCPPSTLKSKSHPDRRVLLKSGKGAASAVPFQQSKVLSRSGRGNLLGKLLQKEETADLRTILLCFRAFALRGLV